MWLGSPREISLVARGHATSKWGEFQIKICSTWNQVLTCSSDSVCRTKIFGFTVNLCLCNQPFSCLLISYLENPRIKKENGKWRSMTGTPCDQLFWSGCHAHEGNVTDLMICVYTEWICSIWLTAAFLNLFWISDLIRNWMRSFIVWAKNLTTFY